MELAERQHCLNMATDEWFALMVRGGQESRVEQALQSKGIATLLPVFAVRKQWSDRLKTLLRPLFPGYLFCRLPSADLGLRVVTTPGVIGFVGFGSGPAALPRHDAEVLARLVKSGRPAVPWPYLRRGQRVRIEQGPFQGLEALVINDPKAYSLILSLDLLQRSVAVEIAREDVVPLPSAGVLAAASSR